MSGRMEVNRYIAEEIYGEPEPEIKEEMIDTFDEGMGNARIQSNQKSKEGNWFVKGYWGIKEDKYAGRKYRTKIPEWKPIAFDEDFDLAMDAVIKAASPEHDEYSVIVERTTHAYYAYYSEMEIYMADEDTHYFPVGYSTSGNGSSQSLANLAVQIHKQRNN